MRISLLIVAFWVTASLSFAQQTAGEEIEYYRQMSQNTGPAGMLVSFDKSNKGVKGTPLLYSDWLPGTVTNATGKTFSNVNVLFDAYKNELYIQRPGEDETMLLDKSQVKAFTLIEPGTSRKREFVVHDQGEGKLSYVENIYQGEKIAVYKVVGKRLKKASTSADSYGGGNSSDQFLDTEDLMVAQGNSVVEINYSLRSVLKAFPNYKAALKKFSKKEDLDLKSDEGMAALLRYYESLL